MYELIQLSENNYYIESPAKVGVIVLGGNDVAIIDSGNDKDAGKKIFKVLSANGWNLKAIFNTHYHADHIGGNAYLQKQTGCKVYASGIEEGFTRYPVLEPAFLYGGNPPKELRHKFLMAQPSQAELLTESVLPEGMEIIQLPGHSFDMVGFRTADNIVYLADCLSSEATLDKYQISFLTDVAAYIGTLKNVMQMDAKCFVPAHAAVTDCIAPLAQKNIDKVMEIGDRIEVICKEPLTFEQILKSVFESYELQMTFEQYALIGSTVKSYLTWLKDNERLTISIEDNCVLWKSM